MFATSVLFAGGEGEQEQRVTAYASADEELMRELFNAFTEETGIKVDWIRLSSGEAGARIEAERENPQASVWYGGVGLGHVEGKQKGLTTVYASPAATMPAQFKDSENYWTGIYVGLLAFASNTERLAKYGLEVPQSWEDITHPRYEGHVQMANPGSSGTAYQVLATLVQRFGEDEAFELLKKLDNNITQYTRSGSAPVRSAGIGEGTIAIVFAHDALKVRDQGYPIEVTFPEEGTGYEIASISLIKNGPEEEQEAAKTLYDWALGETAATWYAKWFAVPFVDVPLSEGAPSLAEVNTIVQDDEWAAANKQRLVAKWNEVIGGEAKTEQ